MFSDGAAAPFTFWDVMCMLALSLAFFRCSFVLWSPWFSGLVLGAGWVRSGSVLRAHWGPSCVSMWAQALVRFSVFEALSGMCGMHGEHRGEFGFMSLYFISNGLSGGLAIYCDYVSRDMCSYFLLVSCARGEVP